MGTFLGGPLAHRARVSAALRASPRCKRLMSICRGQPGAELRRAARTRGLKVSKFAVEEMVLGRRIAIRRQTEVSYREDEGGRKPNVSLNSVVSLQCRAPSALSWSPAATVPGGGVAGRAS